MTHLSRTQLLSLPRCGLMIFVLALAGCDREKIKVQQVPKESEQSVQPPPMQPEEASTMPANPQLKWTLPSGWKDKALSQMRVGSFDAPGKDGQSADVSVIPLPTAGPETELPYYNMWRSELKLDPAEKFPAIRSRLDQGRASCMKSRMAK